MDAVYIKDMCFFFSPSRLKIVPWVSGLMEQHETDYLDYKKMPQFLTILSRTTIAT